MQNTIITHTKAQRLFPILLLFIFILEEQFYINNFTSSIPIPKDGIIIISLLSQIISGALFNNLILSPNDDNYTKITSCSSIVSVLLLLTTLSFVCFIKTLINYYTKFSNPELISFLGISQGFIVLFQDFQISNYPMDIIERNTNSTGANYLIVSQFIYIMSFLLSSVYNIYIKKSFSIIIIFTTIVCLAFYILKVFIIFYYQYKEKKLMKETNISPYVILLFKGFFSLLFFFSFIDLDTNALKETLMNPHSISYMIYFFVLKITVESAKIYSTYWLPNSRAWVEFISQYVVMFINFPSFGGIWLLMTTIFCLLLSFYGNFKFYRKKTINDINYKKFSEL